MKYLKKSAAIEGIRQVFSNTKNDSISIEAAAQAWGRENKLHNENLRWMGNKLTHWKYHGLIQPVYGRRNSRRFLNKIQLTLEGRRALGRLNTDDSNKLNHQSTIENQNGTVSLEEVMKLISKFREENSDYRVTFNIELKDGERQKKEDTN